MIISNEIIDVSNSKFQIIQASSFTSSFIFVCIPLFLAYLVLICLSFNSRFGNIWWFGLRTRNYCELCLVLCPILQVYGNINMKINLFEVESNNVEVFGREVMALHNPENSIQQEPRSISNSCEQRYYYFKS